MSNIVFKSDLSTEGLRNLIRQLNSYTDDLQIKADELVQRLAEEGIRVADYSVYSEWQSLVEFRYEPKNLGEGELIGEDVTLIHRIWYTSENPSIMNQREAYVSPLWMSEYGAGPYALEGHRGTFPGQRNAYRSSWSWFDGSGERHSSTDDDSMQPTRPMYKALIEMMSKVEKIAKEVFSANGSW